MKPPTPTRRQQLAAVDLRRRLIFAVAHVHALRGDPPEWSDEVLQEIFATMSFSQQEEMARHYEAERRLLEAATGAGRVYEFHNPPPERGIK